MTDWSRPAQWIRRVSQGVRPLRSSTRTMVSLRRRSAKQMPAWRVAWAEAPGTRVTGDNAVGYRLGNRMKNRNKGRALR